jgi:hypothetical protein
MTDIEAAERVLAQLSDQKDRASEQVKKMSAERQAWAYSAHVDGSEQAKTRLAALNKTMAEMATTIESLDASLVEARKRLDAAQQATNHEIARGHTKRLLELISNLEEMAAPLDACLGQMVAGQMGGRKYVPGLANPPLLDRAGELIGKICGELNALGLDRGVKWPPRRWSVGHVADLRIELQKMVQAYCGRLPPPSACNFAGLIGVLVAGVKAAAPQHDEQTTNNKVAA